MCNLKYFLIILMFGLPFEAQAQIEQNNATNPVKQADIRQPMPSKTFISDPTQPVQFKTKDKKLGTLEKKKISSFDVQIISYQPNGGSFVVINGKRFVEGDAIDETTIKKIEKDRVVLSNPERKPLLLEYASLSVKKNGGNKP